jgi:osmoprotectant transport system permease protein
MYKTAMTCAGSVLIALLALIADFILSRIEKHLKKKWRMK